MFSKIAGKFKSIVTRLSFRERLLLALFSWTCCFIWSVTFIKRVKATSIDLRTVKASIAKNNLWIKNSDAINDGLKELRNFLKPENSYSGTQFAAKVEEFLRQSGLNYSMTSPQIEYRAGDIFNVNTIKVHCDKATLESLIDFDKLLNLEKPYLSLESIKLRGNEFDPELITADFNLIALQVKNIDL